MVTCQSANQLKTPAKVSWAFKMVSQFGSLGYTIMGKSADLTFVQKTIIDTLHKEGKPQTFIAEEAGCSQSAVSKHVNRKLSGNKRCTTNRPIFLLVLWSILICWDSELVGFCDPKSSQLKRTKDLIYFSLCALNLFNTRVSQFELNYWNKWTFPWHSNLLRCPCTFMRCVI